jgi:hypothetical protein
MFGLMHDSHMCDFDPTREDCYNSRGRQHTLHDTFDPLTSLKGQKCHEASPTQSWDLATSSGDDDDQFHQATQFAKFQNVQVPPATKCSVR